MIKVSQVLESIGKVVLESMKGKLECECFDTVGKAGNEWNVAEEASRLSLGLRGAPIDGGCSEGN